MKMGLVVVMSVVICTACSAEPHQKTFIGDRFSHDSGYWTRYNTDYVEDFWVSSTPTDITFHLTNVSSKERLKPIFSKTDLPFAIDAEYKNAAVSQLNLYPNERVGAGDNPTPDWILAPGQTAVGTFSQDFIAQRYWSDTYLRPVLWKENAIVRFNFNGMVSNPCVVRKHPHIEIAEKWVANAPVPIYFDCSAPTTPAQRLSDNKKRVPFFKRFKEMRSFEYQRVN